MRSGAGRRRDQPSQFAHVFLARRGFHGRGGGIRRRANALLEHVLGQGQHDRTRAARAGEGESARDEFIYARRIVDFRDPFGFAAEHGGIIDLLKRPAAPREALDLADEEDHRRRIMGCDMHPGEGVGRSRPARHEANPGLAGGLAISVGHHRGAGLVATDREGKTALIAGVEHGQIAFARHAIGPVDAIDQQLIDKRARGADFERRLLH